MEQVSSSSSSQNKITVLLKPTSNAPIIKKTKWNVNASYTVFQTASFIRKFLDVDPSVSIFIYINASFAPALDQTIQNLYDCYGSDTTKQLVLYYSTTPAWG